MANPLKNKMINREISWLSFNSRVLQEAQDPRVPLLERLRFLGIFSNNLDEFFRVRVATMKRLAAVSKKKELSGNKTAVEVLESIHEEVLTQRATFNYCYTKIVDELKLRGIYFVNENELTPEQAEFVEEYYRDAVAPLLIPIMLKKAPEFPYLRDKFIYLAVQLSSKRKGFKKQYALIELPTDQRPRFIVLPEKDGKKYVMYLDDVVRFNLDKIFGIFDFENIQAYTIKLTRDAELEIDDDVSKGIYEKMKKSLKQRTTGQPVRFIYDREMPKGLLKYLTGKVKVTEDDNVVAGGRYHNSKDFMEFPHLDVELEWEKLKQSDHILFKTHKSILRAIEEQDVLLHYPYRHFRGFILFLREAAIHPDVKEIKISLYRVARQSRVINALISAAKNGKHVTAMIELRARFDESNNLEYSKMLQEAGVKVIFGIPDMKAHCKLAVVTKVIEGQPSHCAVISTGNFHEDTSKVYSDIALFTAHQEICDEALKVFTFLEKPYLNFRFKHLLVAPLGMRNNIVKKINREIKNARDGKEAYLFLKMNSLVDRSLIKKLYQAGKAGVKIRLIVRGICSLIPGVDGLSENIEVHSIVNRFLEHSRVFIFANGGKEKIYISSADFMERNLDYRVEVCCPVYDPEIRDQIRDFMELQWSDNTKARLIDSELRNAYVSDTENTKKIRAQEDFYEVLEKHQKQIEDKRYQKV